MNLIEISLRRPVFAWVLMSALIIFGAISMNKLGVSQMPDVNFPILNIAINYTGAAPEVVESDIIDPTEQRLLSVEGIKEMRSSATQGSANITLEFDMNRNIDVALQEVQTALSQLRLPTGVDPAVIKKQNPEEDPILYLSISSKTKSITELIRWTTNTFLDELQFIPGVGEVSTGGFPDRNLRVWLDLNKLTKNDLTVNDVIDAVASQHIESAAGQYVEGKREIRVRFLGEARTPQEMMDFPILKRGGQLIQDKVFHIRDVATVEDGLADIRRVARTNGDPAVTVQVRKQRGVNEVEVADAVLKKLKEMKFPDGVTYQINVNSTASTRSTVNLTIEKLWVASLITILICFLFLGNIQSSINILFSIPTSILGTFIILYFSGFTLNLFTLLALTLSISIVVDDAIMILENIVRHHSMGKTAYNAALDGCTEVLPAATAATLAVLAVFLPVIFMDGVIGKFLFQFGITMSAAVCLSLLEGVTITPMRAAVLLGTQKKQGKLELKLDHLFEKFGEKYRHTLEYAIRFKWILFLASMAFFVASMFLIKGVKQEFVPSQDQNLILLTANGNPGTSIEQTGEQIKPIEAVIKQIPEIKAYLISYGPAVLFMPLVLKDQSERQRTHQEIMNVIREKLKDYKGLRISMRDNSARNLTTGRLNPVAFNLRGPDLEQLNDKAQNIIQWLTDQKLAVDVDTDYRLGLPELSLTPIRDQLLKRGVSVEAVSQVLEAAIASVRGGQFLADGKRNDIRFKVNDSQIASVDDVKKLYVRNNYGYIIEIGDIVKPELRKTLQSISRINRQRSVTVYGNLFPGQSQANVLEKAKNYANSILPDGYTFHLEGASAGFSSSFQNMWSTLMIGILVAYMILAVQFNSFRDPIAVLMALPFSASGAIMVLWGTSISLNLFSFIGLIVLMGIAKKNSIMLVEFTVQKLHKGMNDLQVKQANFTTADHIQALLEACPVRLRPILMTSCATVMAALPLVTGGGMGHETRKPMGLVIIGGTIVSTLFTLYVVPIFYLLLNQIRWFKKKEQQPQTRKPTPPPTREVSATT